jgi:hypothetical protein
VPATMFVAIQFAIAVAAADRVPSFDVEPACRAAAERAKPVGDVQACLRLEQQARDELVQKWAEFSGADKEHCVSVSTMARHAPTYTDLLTCLELALEARKAREKG